MFFGMQRLMHDVLPIEYFQGVIEHIIFYNEQTGFCVICVQIQGKKDLVTVTGVTINIAVGQYIECHGQWFNDKKHGLQFQASKLIIVPPLTQEGIEKYLASGMVSGIGPHFAHKLVEAFGDTVFHVIEFEPERLTSLEGFGEKRKDQVVAAWIEQQGARNIMLFLQSFGIGGAKALRIYKTYGDDAIEKIRANPYHLAQDVRGIGFKATDHLAIQLGVSEESPLRAQAGVCHVLQTLCEQGHCAVLYQELLSSCQKLLNLPATHIEAAIDAASRDKQLVQEDIHGVLYVFPILLYQAELTATAHIQRLCEGSPPWGVMDVDYLIQWVEKQTNMTLSNSQLQAIHAILNAKIAIITGGPGVGKTTLVNSLLLILRAQNLNIALCAPTGRSAKRLAEATHSEARTIHRLLQFDPHTRGFTYHENNPLPIDVIIIDESSMIDILLLNHVLGALPTHTAVIFVGDIDQLPSVGSGAVLSDLIASKKIQTVRLTEIYRQAQCSKIITNAYRINQGEMPLPNEQQSDFYTIYAQTPEEIHYKLIQLVCNRLPNYYQCDPVKDIQILTPMNRGGLGTRALNVALQQELNGQSSPQISRFGTTFAPGDKVIQLVNNYEKDVFNGDIGVIDRIDFKTEKVIIYFDQIMKEYDLDELDELSLAYAISIHKSQGSEFPIVVIPLATQHYLLLARNVLYTGVTRGKKIVVLIGQKKAIDIAVKNNKESRRITKLAYRLMESS